MAARTTLTLAFLFALAACAGLTPKDSARAVANLAPTTGSTTSGTVSFVQANGKVLVRGQVRGLKPNSEHGFHVHEKGDCSSGDGMSAGGHFNPTASSHGQHGSGPHHTGDLPSLKADAGGVANFSYETSAIRIDDGLTNVAGKGLIVHRDPDDYKTQPTGNAGPRLACAVIVKS